MILEPLWFQRLNGQMAEFKFESKFEPLQVIWQFLWRLFQKVIKGLEGIINGQALGAALLLYLCWSDRPAQTVFPSWWQLLQAATGLLGKNMLPLLQYWLCSRVNNVLMPFKFLAATSYVLFSLEMKNSMELAFFFMWNENFNGCCWPKQHQLLRSIFPSSIGLSVKI